MTRFHAIVVALPAAAMASSASARVPRERLHDTIVVPVDARRPAFVDRFAAQSAH